VLFTRDSRFEPDASQSPEWNRGAYLAEALAHCGNAIRAKSGVGVGQRKKFAGAVTAGWRAFNILGQDHGSRRLARMRNIVSYLSIGRANGHGTASGPMGEAVDHSFTN